MENKIEIGSTIKIKDNLGAELERLKFIPSACQGMHQKYAGTIQTVLDIWIEQDSGEEFATIDLCSEVPLSSCELYHPMDLYSPNDIHTWFNLSYANYLTIPRSVLQSMPDEWQRRFVKCLEELNETIDWRQAGTYWVRLKDENGRFVPDEFLDYQRGRRKIPHRPK